MADSQQTLRERIDLALSESTEACPRCKTCERQTDAVLAVRDDELAALRREVAYVTETGEKWRRLWEQVNQERSDALVRAEEAEAALVELAPLRESNDTEDRLRRERNEWRERCERAEASLARAREAKRRIVVAMLAWSQSFRPALSALSAALDVPADGEQSGDRDG